MELGGREQPRVPGGWVHSRPGEPPQPQSVSSWAGEVCEASAQGGDAAPDRGLCCRCPRASGAAARPAGKCCARCPRAHRLSAWTPCTSRTSAAPSAKTVGACAVGPARRGDAGLPALSVGAGREARRAAGRDKEQGAGGDACELRHLHPRPSTRVLALWAPGNPQALGSSTACPLIGISPMFSRRLSSLEENSISTVGASRLL